MALRPAAPVFLERRTYRRRRVMDAQRLMPVLGLALWMVPVLWPEGTADSSAVLPMSRAIFYVFGTWCLLIGLSGWVGWWLVRRDKEDGQEGRDGGTDRGTETPPARDTGGAV